jgi:hypothetical protein
MKILNNFLPKNMGDAHEVTRDLEARYDGQLEVLISLYWPARLHRLAELIPWNRFLGSIKV